MPVAQFCNFHAQEKSILPANRTMKNVLFLHLIFSITLSGFSQTKKILIVATNIDTVNNNRSGSYLPEIAYPFRIFTDNGFEVDILTPKGGKTAIYDNGRVPEPLYIIKMDKLFISKTEQSLSPAQVNIRDYSAVFYPGGHGQYFDVIEDERISGIAARIYDNGGWVATAGHGAASLINIRLSNGKWLVDGKTITCFPSWAEKKYMNISGYGKALYFDMQQVLARRGANLFVSADETSRSDSSLRKIVDQKNRMITGSWADDAQWVAEQMMLFLKKTKPKY